MGFTFGLTGPIVRRVTWYARKVGANLDRRFFLATAAGIVVICLLAATAITVVEKPLTLDAFGRSVDWAFTTLFGHGTPGYVQTPGGWVISWLLIIFGVGMLASVTGALVAVVINFLLKEGQGMGVSGYRHHVVICGWDATSRDLIRELRRDDPKAKVVLIHDADRNPAGEHVYYIKGDPSESADLQRAGIEDAAVALVFPTSNLPDADMKSILTVMTIRSMAPGVRIVAEVNDPRHVDHFKRARADELLVTSFIASRLLARAAVYPGVADLITDLVSAGGAELYRVSIPPDFVGLPVSDARPRFWSEHQATFLALKRGATAMLNPGPDVRLQADDDAIILSRGLTRLAPYKLEGPEGLGKVTSTLSVGPLGAEPSSAPAQGRT
jgi:voltage-gated potassium channel